MTVDTSEIIFLNNQGEIAVLNFKFSQLFPVAKNFNVAVSPLH